jgi:hypothetical protein
VLVTTQVILLLLEFDLQPGLLCLSVLGLTCCAMGAHLEVYIDFSAFFVLMMIGVFTIAAGLVLQATRISDSMDSMTTEPTPEPEQDMPKAAATREKKVAETKTKNKKKNEVCKHLRVTGHGSNQFASIRRCKDCNQVLTSSPK